MINVHLSCICCTTYLRVSNRKPWRYLLHVRTRFQTCSLLMIEYFLCQPCWTANFTGRALYLKQIIGLALGLMHRSTFPPHPSLHRPPAPVFQNMLHPDAYTNPTYYCGSHYVQAYHPQTVVNPIPSSTAYTSGFTIPSNNRNQIHPHLMSTWYQPGSTRCFHPGCKFVGSNRSVEIHMMDRHLIFPPGWDKRKKQEWDADPSLKGYFY